MIQPTINYLTASTDQVAEVVARFGSHRKCRLLAVACCRHVWSFISHEPSRELVELTEQFADGQISTNKLNIARRAVYRWARDQGHIVLTPQEVVTAVFSDPEPLGAGRWESVWIAYNAAVPKIAPSPCRSFLRTREYRPFVEDLFGNPFHPIEFNFSWRTDTSTAIAQQMYNSRDFTAMPILADALQDAGCEYDDILNHCRDANGIHVRGCWVVDLVLGKE